MDALERLAEREKELAAIYSICLLAAGAPEPQDAAIGIARALCSAMHRADRAVCRISFIHRESGKAIAEERGPLNPDDAASASIRALLPPQGAGGWEGEIRLEYHDEGCVFLKQESALLESVTVIAASILRTSSLISDLRAMADSLSSKNAALREILAHIEEERRKGLRSIRDRLAAEILPLAERAREEGLSQEKRSGYLSLLVDELSRGVSDLGKENARTLALSPREREIAVQVRNGRTSKEIATLLGISAATVERHRHNIRRKLGIGGSDANLAGLLGSKDTAQAQEGDL